MVLCTTVENSYHWPNICPRLVRLASLASRLEIGGDGVAHGLLKHLCFLVTMTLSEHLGLYWEQDPLGAKKLMRRNCCRTGGSFDLSCHREALGQAGMSAACFGPAVSSASLADHRLG